jgi:hypothetical protein
MTEEALKGDYDLINLGNAQRMSWLKCTTWPTGRPKVHAWGVGGGRSWPLLNWREVIPYQGWNFFTWGIDFYLSRPSKERGGGQLKWSKVSNNKMFNIVFLCSKEHQNRVGARNLIYQILIKTCNLIFITNFDLMAHFWEPIIQRDTLLKKGYKMTKIDFCLCQFINCRAASSSVEQRRAASSSVEQRRAASSSVEQRGVASRLEQRRDSSMQRRAELFFSI